MTDSDSGILSPPGNAAGDAGDTDLLRTFLADRDVSCPQCGYNLRDLRGRRCPECGEDLVLRVNVAEPRQAALITGLVGLSAGAGFSGLLLLYLFILTLRDRSWSDPNLAKFVGITAGGLVVEGIALVVWLWYWRRIRRASRGVRIALAVGCWVSALLNLLVFTFTIK
jgi:hypothetical protein